MSSKARQLIGRGLTALAQDGRRGFHSLREFLEFLQGRQLLKAVSEPVSPDLEITELCYRSIQREGPALRFEHPADYTMPVVGNVFGTSQRIVAALGIVDLAELRRFGELLKELQTPRIPDGLAQPVSEHQ